MPLRSITWVLSVFLHAAVAWSFTHTYEVRSYQTGGGEDDFVVEQGVTIEGISMLGLDTETVHAVEAEPQEVSEARPEIQEVKAEEVVPETKIITSDNGPEQEDLPEEIKEVQQVQQVATVEQQVVVPVEQKIAAGAAKQGGDASATRAYEGKMYAHLAKKMVRPRAGERIGRVVVRFTVDPSGKVLSREVAQTSGIKGIDEAALASIDRASPFPPIPSDVASGPLERTVPIRYRVE